jgi:hypothetical protein
MDKLLYIAPTGNNPSNLEYGWLSEVRLLDFQAPDIETAVMAESSYQRIRWLSQDQLVLVESGMDDGFYTAILNAGDGSITDLGEARLILQKTWDRQISPVVIDFANSAIRRYDQQMKEINAYMTSADNIVAVISLLPDNRCSAWAGLPPRTNAMQSFSRPMAAAAGKLPITQATLSLKQLPMARTQPVSIRRTVGFTFWMPKSFTAGLADQRTSCDLRSKGRGCCADCSFRAFCPIIASALPNRR